MKFTAIPGVWTFIATYDKAFPAVNLAAGATVTGCTSLETGDWGVTKLTDGITTSIAGSQGYTSNPPWTGPNNHECVEIDLGMNTAFNRVKMYPRTGTKSTSNGTPDWPANFTIQVKPDGGNYSTVQTVTNDSNPAVQAKTYDISGQNARYIKIDVTRLGVPASDETANYRFQLAEVEVCNIIPVALVPAAQYWRRPITIFLKQGAAEVCRRCARYPVSCRLAWDYTAHHMLRKLTDDCAN